MERMSDDIIVTRETLIDVSYADGFADGVKEERERCARIAEEYICQSPKCICDPTHNAVIAKQIRNGQ